MTGWASWHLHVASAAPEHGDAALAAVAPTLRALPGPWFFVRYWQEGPHLRVRVADPADPQRLEWQLGRAAAAVDALLRPADRLDEAGYRALAEPLGALGEGGRPLPVPPLRPAGVHRADYRPESDRYGGAAHLATAERLFHRSSGVCLDVCTARADRSRVTADGVEATAAAVAAWPGGAVELLRRVCDGWADWRGAGQSAAERDRYRAAVTTASDRGRALAAPVRALAGGAPSRWSPWTRDLAVAAAGWVDDLGAERARQVFVSHLHMTLNRLGVGGGRDGMLAAVVLGALGAATEPARRTTVTQP